MPNKVCSIHQWVAAGPGFSGTQVKILGFKAISPITTEGIATYGLGNVAETFDGDNQNESSLVYTSPTFMGFTSKSEIDGEGNWGRSLNYAGDFAGANVSLTAYMDSEDRKAGMLVVDYGDVKAAGYTGEDGSGEKFIGGGVKYTMGALSVSADASKSTSDDAIDGEIGFAGEETDMFVGMAYKIAPGLTFNSSLGVEDASVRGSTGNVFGVNNTPAGSIGEVSSKKTTIAARLTLDF